MTYDQYIEMTNAASLDKEVLATLLKDAAIADQDRLKARCLLVFGQIRNGVNTDTNLR